MKKCITAGSLLLLLSMGVNAQNQNLNLKFGLQLSNTFTHTSFDPFISNNYKTDYSTMEWMNPGVSLLIKNKHNNFHEFGITDFSLLQTRSELSASTLGINEVTKNTSSHFGIQYGYVQNFMKKKNSKWMPSVTAGLSADFYSTNYKSTASYSFPSSYRNLLLRGFIAPGLSYAISKKFNATASVPIILLQEQLSVEKNHNPNMPSEYQKTNTDDFTAFPKVFSLKLGLTFKI